MAFRSKVNFGLFALAVSILASLVPILPVAANTSASLTTCVNLQNGKERISQAGKCRMTEAIAKWRLTTTDSGMRSGGTSKTLTICSSQTGARFTYQIITSNCSKYGRKDLYVRSRALPEKPIIAKVESTSETGVLLTLSSDTVMNLDSPIVYYTITSNRGNSKKFYSWKDLTFAMTGLSSGTSYTFTVTATNADGISPISTSSSLVTTKAYVAPSVPRAVSPPSSLPALATPAFTLSASAETLTVNTVATGFTINSTGGAISSFEIRSTPSDIGVPAGMSFNTTTGALTGTPSQVIDTIDYTITATNTSGFATQLFTLKVSAGTATKALMSEQPYGAVSGSVLTQQPIIRITDSAGNTERSFTGNVVASIASGTGTLTGTTTVAAVSGFATFTNLGITGTAGAFTLTFTPTSLTAVTSISFTLIAGPAAKVAITRASVGTARKTPFTTQPRITIQDSGGNTVTSSSAVVTATFSLGGIMIGTDTATATSGVATFTNLGIDGIIGSTYTITYGSSDLTNATSTVILSGTTCNGLTFICQAGDTGPGGGVIFYVAQTTFTQVGATGSMCSVECKYLEAAPKTWSGGSGDFLWSWSGDTSTVIGTTSSAIGAGYSNTLAMVTQSNTPDKAGTKSRAYRDPSNLSDWYLPSTDELNALCKWARGVIGTPENILCSGGTLKSEFRGSFYWSSTETNAATALLQQFASGGQNDQGPKDYTGYVRPIRAIGPTSISPS
jgi:hypothetical protein